VAASTHRAYVGLGANLDDPARQVRAGCAALAALPDTRLTRQSSVYRTRPVGYAEQPDFANAVAELDTGLEPHRLLRELLHIEQRHGRVRGVRNGPRTLDLDLLLYDACQLDDAELTLPHPRLHERGFVLVPLHELAPGLVVPGRGPVADLLAGLDASDVVAWDGAA
jgi:2-amino-4-hydroxy-6-hydroxymethyldihydropteridine diphosphokinase